MKKKWFITLILILVGLAGMIISSSYLNHINIPSEYENITFFIGLVVFVIGVKLMSHNDHLEESM